MSENKSRSVFDSFINLYEFSKTLSFGLIPLRWDEDKKTIVEDCEFSELKKNGIIEKDEQTAKNIKAVKFYLDILHRNFIEKVLGNLRFENKDLQEIYSIFLRIEENKKSSINNEKQKKEISKELNKQLSVAKDALLNKIKESFINENKNLQEEYFIRMANNDIVLLSKYALEILRKNFTKEKVEKLKAENRHREIIFPEVVYLDPEGNEKSIFEINAGYLDDFHKNRKILYSTINKKGSLGRRIIDNFVNIFCRNKKIFEEKYKNSKIDFSKIEKNFCIKIEKFFELEHYNSCISQSGIDKYNEVLGGRSFKQEKKENLKGLNQIINLHCQQEASGYKENQEKTSVERKQIQQKGLSFFLPMQKQILSQFFKKEIMIENDNDLVRELKFFIEKSRTKIEKAQEIVNSFYENKKNNLDLNKIYLSKKRINSFVFKIFKDPQNFLSLFQKCEGNLSFIDFEKVKSYLDKHQLKYKDFFETLIENKKGFDAFLRIWKYEFDILINGGETITKGGKKERVESITTKRNNLEKQLRQFEDKVNKNEKITDEAEGQWCFAILSYVQTVLDITKKVDLFWLNEKQISKISEEKKDIKFYYLLDKFTDDNFTPYLYLDKFRNYLNKRSRSTAKEIKLYFGNEHLLDGWDINKETSYWGFLLRKKRNRYQNPKNNKVSVYDYYLGIGNKHGNIFHDAKGNEIPEAYRVDNNAFFEKVEYKQLDIGKFEGIAFPKKTKSEENFQNAMKERANEFLDGNIEKLHELLNIKKEYDNFKEKRLKEKAWEKKFDIEKMRKLIGYYIICLKKREEWKRFNFNFRKPEDYADRDDFVTHIQRQAYWIDFKKTSEDYINKKVADKELFLFRIHNKDFYDFEKKLSNNNQYRKDLKPSKTNLFTQYFLELFSLENIENIKNKDLNKSIFELDGKAEIRYRRMTDKTKQKPYKKDGKIVTYIDKRDDNKEKKVLQNRRFTKDALTLYLKIRLNFGKYFNLQNFNKLINTKLITQVPVKILGIDRGENNLIYYCILKENGEIEKSGSLNRIGEHIKKNKDGTVIKELVNYHRLLVNRETQRDWERKHWQRITPIKDLKKGYLGNVKNWIVKEVLNNLERGYATLHVLEDLSGGFKKTRFFRERQVYQNFEKELIDKLNYVIDKDCKNYRNAYQFTPLISSIKEMEKNKQIGTVIYVPAGFTSKICPKCGWRKKINVRNSESKKEILNKLKEGLKLTSEESKTKAGAIKISYDDKKDEFRFKYKWEQEYKKDNKKAKYSDIDEVFSNVSRTRWNESRKEPINYESSSNTSITNNLKNLFNKNGISISANINQQLIKKQKELSLNFFQSIIFYLNLILQIRNYNRQKDDTEESDYIQCPSCLFDSRKPEINGKLATIINGDANGAYNIARKGVIMLSRIRENPERPDLFISKFEWDKIASNWNNFVEN